MKSKSRFPDVFHANDIRGLVEELSEELAFAVGAQVAQLTKAKRVVVGRDMRPSSPTLATAVMQGIISQGVDVVDIGMCTTPLFNFTLSHYTEHDAGIMVTASHNPAQYNGFKMSHGDAMPISGKEMGELLTENPKLQPATTPGEIHRFDALSPYLDAVLKEAHLTESPKLSFVVDAGNGMGAVTFDPLFERIGCTTVSRLYFDPDGRFPNHEANPVKHETLAELRHQVIAQKASFGVALDGDADRIGFVDENGRIIPGDVLLAFLAEQQLKATPNGLVIYSPNASWAVRDAVARGQGTPLLEKVGRTFLIKRLMQEKGLVSGEVSGHYFYPAFGYMESTDYTFLLVLKALLTSGQPFSKLFDPYMIYHNSGEMNFRVDDKEKTLKLIEQTYKPLAQNVNTLDGFRFEFENWWFCIRKSNTEPLLRLIVEAKTNDLLQEKIVEIRSRIAP